ncbi:hypothetical protein HHL16_05510 [Pseudoflavitalea sp. G-6-1-2]|uniref:hypothetical protein n=1 Tax=Pseudoflavitalea sp. G-6-1-2 TaxID=2728841 RepID=UPI00146A655D|nr:hypothetical protein [Pseudoflavitalea sp. G-6-1-2]NML20318.1 hypothetical protein [Pseudoflavitalea sp. G-6-1-2]
MKLSGFLLIIFTGIIGLYISSCNRNLDSINRNPDGLPLTPEGKQKAKLHQEFAAMLEQIYQNPDAFREAQAAIWSGYYADERIMLKDLLAPGLSPVYQTDSFKQFGLSAGIFQRKFDSCLATGNYPILSNSLPRKGYTPGSDWQLLPIKYHTAAGSADSISTGMELNGGTMNPVTDAGDVEDLSIYNPYSDVYRPVNPRDDQEWPRATLVAADRDANEAPGREPYNCLSRTCYKDVRVNDDYCELQLTHIAQSGGQAATPAPPPAPINAVLLGNVRCTRQYDHLISFTGNGGGSELRFIRGDGFMKQNSEGQITSPENVISVDLKRSDIRKKRWKSLNSIWDSNWEPKNIQQVFGIYEEDTEGSKSFSGSIKTTIKAFTIEPFGYNIMVKTKDEIIRQLAWDRASFFEYNRSNIGSCGLTDGFANYDCGTPVSYTMPVRN